MVKGTKYILGDEKIPTGSDWFSGGSSSSECQVLASAAKETLIVSKLVVRRAAPSYGEIKLGISAYVVNPGWSGGDIGSRIGIVSQGLLTETNDEQTINVNPPLMVQKGQYIAIWDLYGSSLRLLRTWRRPAPGIHSSGYWEAPKPVNDGSQKLQRWMSYSTSWYAIATGLPPEKKKKKRREIDMEPIIQDCTEEEIIEKQKQLAEAEELVAEEILLS